MEDVEVTCAEEVRPSCDDLETQSPSPKSSPRYTCCSDWNRRYPPAVLSSIAIYHPSFGQGFKFELRNFFLHCFSFNLFHRDWKQVAAESYYPAEISPVCLFLIRLVIFLWCLSNIILDCVLNRYGGRAQVYFAYLTHWQCLLNFFVSIMTLCMSALALIIWRKPVSDPEVLEYAEAQLNIQREKLGFMSNWTPSYVYNKRLNRILYLRALADVASDVPKENIGCVKKRNCCAALCGAGTKALPPPMISESSADAVATCSSCNGYTLGWRCCKLSCDRFYTKLYHSYYNAKSQTLKGPLSRSSPALFNIMFIANSIALTVSLAVVLLYWCLLVPTDKPNEVPYDDVFKHGITFILLFTNALLSRLPVYLYHCVFIFLFGVFYAIIVVIVYVCQVEVKSKQPPGQIYSVLDFRSPLKVSLVFILSLFVILPLLNFLMWTIFRKRSTFTFPPREVCVGTSQAFGRKVEADWAELREGPEESN